MEEGMNIYSLLSIILGGGGVVYGVVMHFLSRKKYAQEVRKESSEADLKGEEFWKQRYKVLESEINNKDSWWKERYDTLYQEFQNERKLSNDIIKSFRTELNEMRNDYEQQRELEKQKYEQLMQQYMDFKEESMKRDTEYKQRINQLEEIVDKYEQMIKNKTIQEEQ